MKMYTSEYTFEHNWDTVVTAVWRKYPNPQNPSVVGLDVIDRSVDSEGKLNSHRLLKTSWGIPGWVSKLIGMEGTAFASEHSVVDPKNKVFTVNSKNLTLSNVLTVNEKLVYSQDPADPNKTILRHGAEVTVSGLPLCSRLEQMVTDAMTNNASKGRQAMEFVIDKLKREARDLTSEAQKCMDTVLPKTNSL